ncbi:unnamed protein product, partial [Scytosiphon promiscuus]
TLCSLHLRRRENHSTLPGGVLGARAYVLLLGCRLITGHGCGADTRRLGLEYLGGRSYSERTLCCPRSEPSTDRAYTKGQKMSVRLLPAYLVGLGVRFLEGFGVRADAAGAEPASTTGRHHGRIWKTRRKEGRRSAGVDGQGRLPVERGNLRLGCLAVGFPPRFTNRGA